MKSRHQVTYLTGSSNGHLAGQQSPLNGLLSRLLGCQGGSGHLGIRSR